MLALPSIEARVCTLASRMPLLLTNWVRALAVRGKGPTVYFQERQNRANRMPAWRGMTVCVDMSPVAGKFGLGSTPGWNYTPLKRILVGRNLPGMYLIFSVQMVMMAWLRALVAQMAGWPDKNFLGLSVITYIPVDSTPEAFSHCW
jgi:hypothetical protein